MNPLPSTTVFDNEAVQALLDPHHRKHRLALFLAEGVMAQNASASFPPTRLVVPTSVRVEAGWDRTAPRAAVINRLEAEDRSLDAHTANTAARLRSALSVSVADAHLGAVVSGAEGPVAVITSDTADVAKMAAFTRTPVTIVRL